jgi:hypothetical protein
MAEMSKIEQLAAQNARPAVLSPMEEWDQAVTQWMEEDNCARDAAVDRILARTTWGPGLWNRACSWWAAQPQVVIENGVQVRTGNWGNRGSASLRRIPRKP